MSLATIAACVEIFLGLGAVLWGWLLILSCLREHRRRLTVEVEILGELKLAAGVSYRFSVIEGSAEANRSNGESDWIAGAPRKFNGRNFSVGEVVSIDYDPGYPAFFYPAGKYPRCRLWPLALAVAAIGTAAIVFGGIGLM